MITMSRCTNIAKIFGVCAALAASLSYGQTYPARPVRLLIPFAPGGIFDFVGRVVSPKLSESLGQTVVVDNRPGGGGMIAMSTAAKATPDGYTVLLADPSLVINLSLQPNPPYALKELSPVSVLTTASLVLAVHSKVAARNVKELIDVARAGKLSYGSAGVGTTPHMAAELFKDASKAPLLHVPFKGIGPAVTAVASGQVQVVFGSVAGTESFIRDGRMRGLATTGERRAKALPDLPTLVEAGYPGAVVSVWGTVLVPAGTSTQVISRLNADFRRALAEPEVKNAFDKAAIEPLGTTPADASAFIASENKKWAAVIRAAGIKLE